MEIRKKLMELAEKAHKLKGDQGVCYPFAILAADFFHKAGYRVRVNEGNLYVIAKEGTYIVEGMFGDSDYEKYGHWWIEVQKDDQWYTCDLAEWDSQPYFAEGQDYYQENKRPVPRENFIWENVKFWGYDAEYVYEWPRDVNRIKKEGEWAGYDVDRIFAELRFSTETTSGIEDLIETVREECPTYDDFLFKIGAIRTRPYSRIAALIEPEEGYETLERVCKGQWVWASEEVEDYVRRHGYCKPVVTIYRGGSEILPGDWVALEKGYARSHGEPVYSKKVPWTDVVWAGTYEKEWYYVPRELQGKFKSLEDFWRYVKGR